MITKKFNGFRKFKINFSKFPTVLKNSKLKQQKNLTVFKILKLLKKIKILKMEFLTVSYKLSLIETVYFFQKGSIEFIENLLLKSLLREGFKLINRIKDF